MAVPLWMFLLIYEKMDWFILWIYQRKSRPSNSKYPGSWTNQSDFESVGRQFKGTKYQKRVRQIFEDSGKLDYEQLPVPFDMFFIDGCHDYEYVKHDSQMALKYTRKGGVIIWHDYGMIEDVSRYVDTLSSTMDIHAIRGCRLAYSSR